MPFVKKNDSRDSRPQSNANPLFIGRTEELQFFVHNILLPEVPSHNILAVSGQGGVGKSSILTRFLAEAHAPDFKEYCLTASVDERQVAPLSIMKRFAKQLHIAGAFKNAVDRYMERSDNGQSTKKVWMLGQLPDITGATVEGIPVIGPLLREGVKVGTTHLLDEYQQLRKQRFNELRENPLHDLTHAFITELNRLADAKVPLSLRTPRRERRLLLFFDTFEQVATEVVPWLLDHFLDASISANVVLIIAGRDPLYLAIPDRAKDWLPYDQAQTIFSMQLESFSEEETCIYLTKRGIRDAKRTEMIWNLSRGLPLYLGLLTSNPHMNLDPTKDVVTNFLQWIPEQDQTKQRLVLDASLLSRPFNEDDLQAYTYLSEQERATLYRWLTRQSFVRTFSFDGRHIYHEVVQEFLCRYFYQRSPEAYYATRRALARYYEQLLEAIEQRGKSNARTTSDWLELVLALASQLYFLPDEVDQARAIDLFLRTWELSSNILGKELDGMVKILRVLYSLSRTQVTHQAGADSWSIARQLSLCIQARLADQWQVMLTAINDLLEHMLSILSPSLGLLARLYGRRGWAYNYLKEYRRAIEDFDQMLALSPQEAEAYNGRGWAYKWLGEYQLAIEDFRHALELDPFLLASYHGQGIVYRELREYQLSLDAYNKLVKLNPNFARSYQRRGYTFLWLRDLQHAKEDFHKSWKLDSSLVRNGWLEIWTEMCQDKPPPNVVMRLEAIAAVEPNRYSDSLSAYGASVCRGIAHWFREDPKKAYEELSFCVQQKPERWEAYFWLGMTYLALGSNDSAITAIEKALILGLPPILLTPLRWFEQKEPKIYVEYVASLLDRSG